MIEVIVKGDGHTLILQDRVNGKLKKAKIEFTDLELKVNSDPKHHSYPAGSMRALIACRVKNAVKTLYAE